LAISYLSHGEEPLVTSTEMETVPQLVCQAWVKQELHDEKKA